MVDLVSGMPKPPPPPPTDQFNPELTKCVCGKYVPVVSCEVAWSGYTNYVVALCQEHRKDLGDMARVVCPRCKSLVLLVSPHKDKQGFEFKKGGVYHVEACPGCRPGLRDSAIVEKIVFYKRNNILYDKGTNQLLT